MKKNNNYYDQYLASFATCTCTCRFSNLTLADLDETWSLNVGESEGITFVKVACDILTPLSKLGHLSMPFT